MKEFLEIVHEFYQRVEIYVLVFEFVEEIIRIGTNQLVEFHHELAIEATYRFHYLRMSLILLEPFFNVLNEKFIIMFLLLLLLKNLTLSSKTYVISPCANFLSLFLIQPMRLLTTQRDRRILDGRVLLDFGHRHRQRRRRPNHVLDLNSQLTHALAEFVFGKINVDFCAQNDA